MIYLTRNSIQFPMFVWLENVKKQNFQLKSLQWNCPLFKLQRCCDTSVSAYYVSYVSRLWVDGAWLNRSVSQSWDIFISTLQLMLLTPIHCRPFYYKMGIALYGSTKWCYQKATTSPSYLENRSLQIWLILILPLTRTPHVKSKSFWTLEIWLSGSR